MTIFWNLGTHGDPIGAIQTFFQRVWEQQKLDGFLVQTNRETCPSFISDKADLAGLNPFHPLMRENIASKVRETLDAHPDRHLGVLLHPCEMQTLVELMESGIFPETQLTTMTVDCLGTFPEEEYQWRVSRKTSHEQFTNETLHFAHQSGILAYRYRAACQICPSPEAHNADVNIHVFGLPIRKQLLIETYDDKTSDRLAMTQITDGEASPELIEQYQQMLGRQKNYHLQTTERVIQVLGDLLPRNLDALAAELENCQECQRCMEVCPLCAIEFPQRDPDGHYEIGSLQRWLVKCTGCGVCEQECKRNLPLSVIYRSIKEKLLAHNSFAA